MKAACFSFWFIIALAPLVLAGQANRMASQPAPVCVIFDTDIGNDVDDVMALAMLHALETRGKCRLLAVTVTKPDELAGPFVDVLNTFYGRPDIPIGCLHPVSQAQTSKFLGLAAPIAGRRPPYPHRLRLGSDAPLPTRLLRRVLSAQPDHSVVLIQVGYFSNCAALLGTPPDAFSALEGRQLVKRKVKFLSVMAGAFKPIHGNSHFLEFNVTSDIPSARRLAQQWPTPIVWSGFEIGIAVPYPAVSIERDFNYVPHHPVAEAYRLYQPPPHQRPTWDLTAALYAVLPDRGYFDLSAPGRVTVEADGFTRFTPRAGGRDRYLILNPDQNQRVREAFVQLVSQPPNCLKATQ